MRMIEIYHEKKRQKKAELRKTLFDPKSWFGKIKVNNDKSKIEIIEDHFQTIWNSYNFVWLYTLSTTQVWFRLIIYINWFHI